MDTMKLKKTEKIYLAVGGGLIVLLLIWTYAGGSKQKPKPVKASDADVVNSVKSTVAGNPSANNTDRKMHFENWGRDPFMDRYTRMANAEKAEDDAVGKLVVKGVFYRGGKPRVLINDIVLGEGEEKDGLYVESIGDHVVRCRKGNKWLTLTWKDEP